MFSIFVIVWFNKELPSSTTKLHYEVPEAERVLLAKLVTCEASICSVECQQDIVSVVFNRLESGKWQQDMNGDKQITLYDIIYYPNAFSPVVYDLISTCEPTNESFEAVDYVIKNGSTIPEYVRYFRSDYDFEWDNYNNYKIIDNVYFGYFTTWEEGVW